MLGISNAGNDNGSIVFGGMEFVLIQPGSYWMGGVDGNGNEKPRHFVTISAPFYLGKYQVTQAQWEAVMGSNPSHSKEGGNPVECVSWNDIQEYIRRLNEGADGGIYRLPTEAEWEYACRANTSGRYYFGDEPDSVGDYAWYGKNSKGKTHPVGQKKPNSWGVYDMHGNVWEWVQDWYAKDHYEKSPESDPVGPSSGVTRVLRGGSWHGRIRGLRSSCRNWARPDYQNSDIGFRLARSLRNL
jgi:formylglycine-generating enzyme required for sulfatase activity